MLSVVWALEIPLSELMGLNYKVLNDCIVARATSAKEHSCLGSADSGFDCKSSASILSIERVRPWHMPTH